MAHVIEIAKTGRSKCRSCKKTIDKGEFRLGEETVNAFSSSGELTFLWHHLACAAQKRPEVLRTALAGFSGEIPNRVELDKQLQSAAEADKLKPKGHPYAEHAPTGRSKCLGCEEAIEKDKLRIVVEREIDTGSFVTKGSGYLHPGCAGDFLGDEPEILSKVKANSPALSAEDVAALEADLA